MSDRAEAALLDAIRRGREAAAVYALHPELNGAHEIARYLGEVECWYAAVRDELRERAQTDELRDAAEWARLCREWTPEDAPSPPPDERTDALRALLQGE